MTPIHAARHVRPLSLCVEPRLSGLYMGAPLGGLLQVGLEGLLGLRFLAGSDVRLSQPEPVPRAGAELLDNAVAGAVDGEPRCEERDRCACAEEIARDAERSREREACRGRDGEG